MMRDCIDTLTNPSTSASGCSSTLCGLGQPFYQGEHIRIDCLTSCLIKLDGCGRNDPDALRMSAKVFPGHAVDLIPEFPANTVDYELSRVIVKLIAERTIKKQQISVMFNNECSREIMKFSVSHRHPIISHLILPAFGTGLG
jgi:hypothetical protein